MTSLAAPESWSSINVADVLLRPDGASFYTLLGTVLSQRLQKQRQPLP